MAGCLEFGADLPIYKWSRETIKGSLDAKRAGLLLFGLCEHHGLKTRSPKGANIVNE